MDEDEQFVSIDLNDDNICSVCKLETETGTLSFCHVCFEFSIEGFLRESTLRRGGLLDLASHRPRPRRKNQCDRFSLHSVTSCGVASATLMHSKSLRGHRDCFEKCHLIANQKLSHSKVSQSAYEGIKLALSQKLSRIVQYAQNKDSISSSGPSRRGAKLLCYSEQSNCKRFGQPDARVPRYAPCRDTVKATGLPDYAIGMLECHAAEELGLLQESECDVWSSDSRKSLQFQNLSSRGATPKHRHQRQSRDDLTKMSVEELHHLNGQLLVQIQKVFEELTAAVQEKDSLASELQVRHIAIEQLFKNCAKLPWLHISRAGIKASSRSSNNNNSNGGPVE